MGLFDWLWGDPAAGSDRCRVVLYDSRQHSYMYVIQMIEHVCGVPQRAGYELAKQIDQRGHAVVFTGTRDECEHIRRVICDYGPDSAVESSAGSMRAEVVRV
jgi:ATP-dependent Clp protease adapter protein ClpS